MSRLETIFSFSSSTKEESPVVSVSQVTKVLYVQYASRSGLKGGQKKLTGQAVQVDIRVTDLDTAVGPEVDERVPQVGQVLIRNVREVPFRLVGG